MKSFKNYKESNQEKTNVLDLSAALDTIDDSILITHLSSWFGFRGSVFNWFKSHLSSWSFRVKCHSFSSSRVSSWCSSGFYSLSVSIHHVHYSTQ